MALTLAVGMGAAVPAAAAPPAGPVPVPTLVGPITGGVHGILGTTPVDISGYTEQEYFFSGSARCNTAIPLTGDSGGAGGGCTVPAEAPYTSRILVRRPIDPARFNGTLVIEWYNVTDPADNDFDWHRYFPEILKGGYAFAAISVQQAGIPGMKAWDPVRYQPINHPGDFYAYDIWAQGVQALRTPKGVNPLAGLSLKRVIGTGDSQSANELSSYIGDGVSAANHNIDGYMIDSGTSPPNKPDVPVLENQTEGDLINFGTKATASGPHYRLWSVVGASHADYWQLQQGRSFQQGTPAVNWDPEVAGQYGERGVPTANNCQTVSDMFPAHYAWDASLHALNQWVITGTPPPPSPRFTVDSSGHQITTDRYGNGLGGLRLPPIDVPVATYQGYACGLYGMTTPLDGATLAALYPTHQDYVDKMAARTRAAVAGGWMMGYDGVDLVRRACASDIGGPAASATCPRILNAAGDLVAAPAGPAARPQAAQSVTGGLPTTSAQAEFGKVPALVLTLLLAVVAVLAGLFAVSRPAR
ncbi:MAG: alpha/beta hydrolase domain-containing protein [Candidatus Dormibacteria bacterium]